MHLAGVEGGRIRTAIALRQNSANIFQLLVLICFCFSSNSELMQLFSNFETKTIIKIYLFAFIISCSLVLN